MTNIDLVAAAAGGFAGFLVTVVVAVAVCRRLLAAKNESCARLLEEKDKACTKLLAEKDAMLTRNFAETVKTLREQFSVLAAQT